jgi:hypothetical protein
VDDLDHLLVLEVHHQMPEERHQTLAEVLYLHLHPLLLVPLLQVLVLQVEPTFVV